MNRICLCLALATPLGCSREPPPSPATTTTTAAPIDSAPPPRPPADGGAGEAGAPPHKDVCEVEITGTVRLPAKFANAPEPLTFVALGDCLAPSPDIVGFSGSSKGRFFVEVFVPWGSDVTICAASEPAPGKPSTLYGKAASTMHAEQGGEVEFKGVTINLAPGPPRVFEHRAGAPRGR